MYLTIWWDGESDDFSGRASMRRAVPGSRRTREVDVTPLPAYRKRLGDALGIVTQEPDDPVFQVDTMDPVLVGIACAMEDSAKSVLALLRTWSVPVAAAITEIASLGGWLPQARPRSRGLIEQGFSSEDLMVLSQGPPSQPSGGDFERDAILEQYAGMLTAKHTLQPADGQPAREGWELAVSVYGRLDDQASAQRQIAELLARIELDDEVTVDRVLTLCRSLGLRAQERAISEVWPGNSHSSRSQLTPNAALRGQHCCRS